MPERSGEVQRAYNAWVRQYDTNENPTRDLNAEVLRRQPLDLEGKAILELGCGTGGNTVWLAERARSVVGVDLSEGMLARARRRLASSGVRLIRADVTRPWPIDWTFDGIVINLILEHVRDLRPIFAEARRVLRPGGFLYLGELHPYKQLAGSQARYRDEETGDEIRVPAFLHSVSEYLNGALAAGFVLERLGEWPEDADAELRLLTLLLALTETET